MQGDLLRAETCLALWPDGFLFDVGLYRGYIGRMENQMETTIMEKKMETTVWCSAGQESQNQEHKAAAGGRPHRPSADHSARKFPRTKHLSEDLMRFILGSTCSLREFLTVAKLSLMLLLRTVGSVWARAPAVRCLYKSFAHKAIDLPSSRAAARSHELQDFDQ